MKIPNLFHTFKTRCSLKTSRPRRVLRRLGGFAARKIAPFAPLAAGVAAFSGPALAQTGAKLAVAPVSWWQALILGLVQGLTEFIPISSSGHLNITHWLFHQPRDLAFDVFLHIGTLAALAFYFRNDWKALLTQPAQRKMRNFVFLACVPAAIAGVLLRDLEEKLPLFTDVRFNATMLAVAGLVLFLADKGSSQKRAMETISAKDALIIGASQAVALIPGVSRSGSTLTAGLLLGLKRADAARFSFLMSLPITLGAILFEARGLIKGGSAAINASAGVVGLGIVVSALSGFWAIGFLLNYLKSKDVTPFFIWRVMVAVLVFALYPFISR